MVLLLKLIGVERKNFKKYKISLSPFFIGEPASIQNHNVKPDRLTLKYLNYSKLMMVDVAVLITHRSRSQNVKMQT